MWDHWKMEKLTLDPPLDKCLKIKFSRRTTQCLLSLLLKGRQPRNHIMIICWKRRLRFTGCKRIFDDIRFNKIQVIAHKLDRFLNRLWESFSNNVIWFLSHLMLIVSIASGCQEYQLQASSEVWAMKRHYRLWRSQVNFNLDLGNSQKVNLVDFSEFNPAVESLISSRLLVEMFFTLSESFHSRQWELFSINQRKLIHHLI